MALKTVSRVSRCLKTRLLSPLSTVPASRLTLAAGPRARPASASGLPGLLSRSTTRGGSSGSSSSSHVHTALTDEGSFWDSQARGALVLLLSLGHFTLEDLEPLVTKMLPGRSAAPELPVLSSPLDCCLLAALAVLLEAQSTRKRLEAVNFLGSGWQQHLDWLPGLLEEVRHQVGHGTSAGQTVSEFPILSASQRKRLLRARCLKLASRTLAQRLHDLEGSISFPMASGHGDSGNQHLKRFFCELLLREDIVTQEEVRRSCEVIDDVGAEPLGPRLVARAWTDPSFKEQFLKDPIAASREAGLPIALQHGAALQVVESSSRVHNLVVCTLCSCYPVTVLGLAPAWYKSESYRSQAVQDPRGLLERSFDLSIPDSVDIVVWDSNAQQRYLVLPVRPEGTESWPEDDLKRLVTRDTMIGTALA